MAGHQHHGAAANAVDLFPARDASGTAWLPEDTPMFGSQHSWSGWDVMLNGVAFASFLYEPGDVHRTGGFSTHQFVSTNWGMLMARRRAGPARVGIRAMVSLEPWSVPGCGYISFLATGEVCEKDTIHDRQHPHDLVMELAADYDRALRGSWRWQLYGGLAGEPALGPPAFPHRISAMLNPIAPMSHHWMDSTHITFGLVTAGVYDRRWKLEMSVFNGREPDENRGDLDLAALDSFSGRVTLLPNDRLALQISAGHLRDEHPEFAPHPPSNVDRATASATYHRPLGTGGIWATTLAWGVNSGLVVIPIGDFNTTTHALLLESSATFDDRHTWFGRGEVVQKPAEDLHAHEYRADIFTLAKIQGGYVRQFKPWKGLTTGLGGSVSLSIVPPELAPRYGGRVAPGVAVFATIRPPRHAM
ncbi:MAG: hypothetical protein ACJ731_10540 [Vicinamibacterales bacterium]